MIPLVKPYLPPKELLIPELEKVLYSGYIAEGIVNEEFEKKLSDLVSNPFCLTLNSGTSALHISLILAGVSFGDEVISTALTAEPTTTAIASIGAKVVFADVDRDTGLISPESIIANITSKTKAIMVVHYAGMVCDMHRINEISANYGIPVIEDAAHAFLSMFNGKPVGSNSPFTCFSFQAIKHLTTVDGGLICLKDEENYIRAKKLRWFGLNKKLSRHENNITEAGFKYHMNNVNAIIGLVQLENINQNVKRYISNGEYYDQKLKGVSGINLIQYYQDTKPSYWLYTFKVEERREDFIKWLSENEITASTLHLRNDAHQIFRNRFKSSEGLNEFYDKFVHIPCGWWITDDIRDYIIEVIKKGW